MTLDDSYVSNAEMMRRARERDWADAKERADERALCESEEAIEAYWHGVFRQMPDHVRRTRYGSDVTS